jgi:LysM repeat protein
MTLRKSFLLACILLLPLTAIAGQNPQIYTIKKGDTLWGISEQFLKDPYYWPNLWSNNPELLNPHFIYPGQKLAIYDGRIEIVPAEAPQAEEVVTEQPATESAEVAEELEVVEPLPTEVQEEITIKIPGGGIGFLGVDDLNSVGRIIDATDNRLILGTGDTAFLEMDKLGATYPGTRLSIFSLGDKVYHPVSKKLMGYQVYELGTMEIVDVHSEVASGRIVTALREILRGSLVAPYIIGDPVISLKRAQSAVSGYLVATQRGQSTIGQFDVVFTDLGSNAGVEVGNLLHISRPRKASTASLADLKLPDILVGEGLVLSASAQSSAVLVLKAVDTIDVGDRVSTFME